MGERGNDDFMRRLRQPSNRRSLLRTTTRFESRPTAPHEPEACLGQNIQARIGQQLRATYNDVVDEGIPQHITDLVRRVSDRD